MEINRSKCELAGIGSKMNVPTSLDGIKNVSLITDSIRVLGVHFTYSTKLSIDRNFTECIKKLQNIIRVWGMRSLTLYGKVTIFKTLALSKVICIASMSNIPNDIVKLIEQIHLDFIWSNKRPNIKHSTLIGDYAKGGLKDVDIPAKMKALHLSWINRLFDSNSRPWKLIPLYHINKVSSDTILFHPNLCISDDVIKDVPIFYQNIIKHWKAVSQSAPTTAAMVLSECLWFNSCILIDNKPIIPSFCGTNKTIFLLDLFTNDGRLITWLEASNILQIRNYFKWIQIINAIPLSWKNIVKNTITNRDTCCTVIHINKGKDTVPLGALNSKFFYTVYRDNMYTVPTSQKYFDQRFGPELKWDDIYLIPRVVTKDTYIQIFQYKILHNTLFLNARLFHLNYSTTPLCTLCNTTNETPVHFFCECDVTYNLWCELVNFLNPSLQFNHLTPQNALLGFLDKSDDDFIIKNHLLLIFKYVIYKNRSNPLNIHIILHKLKTVFQVEKHLYASTPKFDNKWSKISHLL